MKIKERLLLFMLRALGCCSLKNLYRLARVIYWLLLPFPLKFKRTIRINMGRCLPELAPEELKRLVQLNIFQTILRILEMIFFWFAPKSHIEKVHWEIVGEDAFKTAFQHGKGIITLVPHLGAWEAVNYYMGTHFPSVSLYKPRKKDYQELLLRVVRERFGVQMFPTTTRGLKGILQALKAGKCAGILPDHDPGDNGGIFVPFFDIAANTTTLIAKLAARSQAPIFFVTAERMPKGQGFRLHFIPGDPAIGAQDLELAATTLNTQTSAIIKKFPEQYEWSYKRFRRTRWGHVWFYETSSLKMPRTAKAIGLVGGAASGKTTIAKFFTEAGAEVIDTDAIARELTQKNSSTFSKIIDHFGTDILTPQGELNRARLREIIFADKDARLWLEALLHPLIRHRVKMRVMSSKAPYCVVVIPLLKRREDYPFLHRIFYITTPREVQLQRLMARDHISETLAQQILDAQPTDAEFRKIADFMIDNNNSISDLHDLCHDCNYCLLDELSLLKGLKN